MKKILLGSIVLSTFSLAIIMFQISCQKSATAQSGNSSYTLPPATSSTLGGVIVGSGLSITSSGILSVTPPTGNTGLTQLNKIIYTKVINSNSSEIWISNYDGTGNAKVNIVLPSGIGFSEEMVPVLSPNGQKIFFTAGTLASGSSRAVYGDIYSCNADGSGVVKIVDRGASTNGIIIGGAY